MAWQPIDTAPKFQGPLVLAGQYRLSKRWQIEIGEFILYRNRWPQVGEDQPTHWMPLPAPPALTEDK